MSKFIVTSRKWHVCSPGEFTYELGPKYGPGPLPHKFDTRTEANWAKEWARWTWQGEDSGFWVEEVPDSYILRIEDAKGYGHTTDAEYDNLPAAVKGAHDLLHLLWSHERIAIRDDDDRRLVKAITSNRTGE